MPLSEVNRWKKKRQRKKEKEQRNDLQNYSERVRNTAVLLFCLKKEKRKNLKRGHNKALLRIKKWEVGWWFSQHLRIWFFFLFTNECGKGVDTLQEKQDEKKKRQVLSEKIKKDAGHHTLKYVIPEARRRDCKNLSFTFAT